MIRKWVNLTAFYNDRSDRIDNDSTFTLRIEDPTNGAVIGRITLQPDSMGHFLRGVKVIGCMTLKLPLTEPTETVVQPAR